MSSPKRPRRFGRVLRRILLALLVLAIVVRLVLPWLLPVVLDRSLRSRALTAHYEHLDLSLLGGAATLWNLEVWPCDAQGKPAGERLLHVERADVDLDMLPLLVGTLRVRALAVDGLDVLVERTEAGTLELARHFPELVQDAPPSTTTPAMPPPTRGPGTAALDFRSPVAVLFARFQNATVRLRDRTLQDPAMRERTLALGLRVTDLGVAERPLQADATLRLRPDGGALAATVRAETGLRLAHAKCSVTAENLRLHLLGSWLEQLGLRPATAPLSAAAHLALDLEPVTTDRECSTGALAADLEITTGSEPAAAALDATVPIANLSASRVALGGVVVRGVRARAARSAIGNLVWAGLEFLPRPPSPRATPAPPGPARAFSLASLTVDDASASFADLGVTAAPTLNLVVTKAQLGTVDSSEPAPARELPFEIVAKVPGVVEGVRLSGTAKPLGSPSSLVAALRMDGIGSAVLAPWLAPYGLAPTLRAGTLRADLTASARLEPDGAIRAAFGLTGVELADTLELAAVDRVEVDSLVVDPAHRALTIGNCTVAGVRAHVERDAARSWHACGIRTLQGQVARAAEAGPQSRPADAPWRTTLGTLRVATGTCGFTDAALLTPARLVSSGVQCELRDFVFPGPAARPARFSITSSEPGVVDSLAVNGTFTAGVGPLDCTVQATLAGNGLSARPLAPWLATLGLAPEFENGAIACELSCTTLATASGLRLEAELRRAEVRRADVVLARLAAATVTGAEFAPGSATVREITLAGARVDCTRTSDGALHVLGIATTGAASAPEPASRPSSRPEAATGGVFRLASLAVADTTFGWKDELVNPAVDLAPQLTARLDGFVFGAAADAARFSAGIVADSEFTAATVKGTLRPDPDAFALGLELGLEGAKLEQLARYLPPQVRCEWRAVSAHAALDLASARAEAGGRTFEFTCRDVEVREANASTALLTAPRFSVQAPRLDPEAAVYEIAACTNAGLGLPLTRDRDGTLHAVGFALQANAAPAVQRSPATPPQDAVPTARPIPRLALGRFDLALGPITIADSGAAPGSTPLEFSGRASTPAPLVLLDPDWEHAPPIPLLFELEAAPLCRRATASVELEPFLREPAFTVTVNGEGLCYDSLLAALPDLRERIVRGELHDGRFAFTVHGSADWKRRHPLDFAIDSGFAAEFEVRKGSLREGADGPVLLGLEAFTIDAKRIVPATGDVHLRSVELLRPAGEATLAADGVHFAGLVLRSEPATAGPASRPSAPVAAVSPTGKKPELRIDEVLFSGLDFTVRDTTTTPNSVFPLAGLDVEVRRFTTRAMTEPLPLRFSASLQGGAIALPPRSREALVRPFLEEVNLRGALTLFGQPSGWVKLDVSGLELASFKPLAGRSGVTLNDGVLDAGMSLLMLGDKGAELDLRSGFRGLSVSEPANGPLQQLLKLPTSLDTVLFALENQDKEIKIPMGFRLAPEGVSGPEFARIAVVTLSGLIARAVAAAPFRVTGALGDVVGIGAEAVKPRLCSVRFELAEAMPDPSSLAALDPLVERMREEPDLVLVLQHEFGADEVTRFEEFANPPAPVANGLLRTLSVRRAELQREHDLLAATTRTEIAAGSALGTTVARDRLAAAAGEIAATEVALDHLATLLRPDAERSAPRRTREAAAEVAFLRLHAVRAHLLARGIPSAETRIDVRRPRWEAVAPEPTARIVATARRRSS